MPGAVAHTLKAPRIRGQRLGVGRRRGWHIHDRGRLRRSDGGCRALGAAPRSDGDDHRREQQHGAGEPRHRCSLDPRRERVEHLPHRRGSTVLVWLQPLCNQPSQPVRDARRPRLASGFEQFVEHGEEGANVGACVAHANLAAVLPRRTPTTRSRRGIPVRHVRPAPARARDHHERAPPRGRPPAPRQPGSSPRRPRATSAARASSPAGFRRRRAPSPETQRLPRSRRRRWRRSPGATAWPQPALCVATLPVRCPTHRGRLRCAAPRARPFDRGPGRAPYRPRSSRRCAGSRGRRSGRLSTPAAATPRSPIDDVVRAAKAGRHPRVVREPVSHGQDGEPAVDVKPRLKRVRGK